MKDIDHRIHYAVTDDSGNILYCSSHKQKGVKDCFFTSGILSKSDLCLIEGLGEYRYSEKVLLLRDTSNEKTILLITTLFPSTRTYVLLFTDVNYEEAVGYRIKRGDERIISEQTEANGKSPKAPTRGTEAELDKLIRLSDIIFPAAYSPIRISNEQRFNQCLRELAEFAYAEADIMSCRLTDRYFDDFDSELFSLFALAALSAASEFSDTRRAEITVGIERLRMKVTVTFSMPKMRRMRKGELQMLEGRVGELFRHIRYIADRKNIPLSFICDKDFRCEIIPHSIDFAYLGIKEPITPLKSFDFSQKEEQDKQDES